MCARCRTPFDTWTESAPPPSGGGHSESIASVLYVVAFVLSCAGGGGVIALAGAVLGEEAMQSNTVLIGGFMVGTLGSLFAMIYAIGRWKDRADGVTPRGGLVRAPADEGPPSSRTELLVGAAFAAAFGAFSLYYLGEWEREGGTRTINTIFYGLYMLLGKWGVTALCWIASAVMIWKAVRR